MNYAEIIQIVFEWDTGRPHEEEFTIPFDDEGLAEIAEAELRHNGYEVYRKYKSGITFLIVKRKS